MVRARVFKFHMHAPHKIVDPYIFFCMRLDPFLDYARLKIKFENQNCMS